MSQVATVQAKNGSVSPQYQRRAVAPPVDVFENSEELLLIADVPGVSADALDVRIENGMLTLEGRRAKGNDADSPALLREYEDVDFVRTFRIPDGIDTANISGETKNGAIVVRLPKAAAAKSRKIVVRAG